MPSDTGALPLLSMLSSTQCLPKAMATGPGPVAAYDLLPIARKILHSPKKKKKCTHPVLIKSKSAEQSGGACPVEAPHKSPGEQSARVGCHSVLYASCSLPLMTLFRIGNI